MVHIYDACKRSFSCNLLLCLAALTVFKSFAFANFHSRDFVTTHQLHVIRNHVQPVVRLHT